MVQNETKIGVSFGQCIFFRLCEIVTFSDLPFTRVAKITIVLQLASFKPMYFTCAISLCLFHWHFITAVNVSLYIYSE